MLFLIKKGVVVVVEEFMFTAVFAGELNDDVLDVLCDRYGCVFVVDDFTTGSGMVDAVSVDAASTEVLGLLAGVGARGALLEFVVELVDNSDDVADV